MNDFEKDGIEELETEEIVSVVSESEAEETAEEVVSEVTETAETVEEAPEAEEAPKKYAGHMTASAAALNAAGEVDIRRKRPREEKKIKEEADKMKAFMDALHPGECLMHPAFGKGIICLLESGLKLGRKESTAVLTEIAVLVGIVFDIVVKILIIHSKISFN